MSQQGYILRQKFQFVTNGDLANVELIIFWYISTSKHFADIINSNDTFGSNLIVCASAEEYIEIMKYISEIACSYELNKIIKY